LVGWLVGWLLFLFLLFLLLMCDVVVVVDAAVVGVDVAVYD